MSTPVSRPSAPRTRPTLKTIAELSGLAVTTVSRALGDAPDISEDTKEKVRRIAAEIGYVPNRAGVRLRTGRTNVIALILPTEGEITNMTHRLIASVAEALDGTPFHLIVVPEMQGRDRLAPVRYVVETGSADAIILNGIAPEDERVAYLREKKFPFVTHGRTVWRDEHAWFDYDNSAFGRIAVKALAERGRRALLLVAPPKDMTYGQDILRSAEAEAAARGVRLVVAGATSDDSQEKISGEVAGLLATNHDIDGMICASPHSAMVSVAPVEARGHVIGEDFDIYAKETFPLLSMFRGGIMTISEDIGKAGRFLAEAAVHEVRSGGKSPLQALDTPPD